LKALVGTDGHTMTEQSTPLRSTISPSAVMAASAARSADSLRWKASERS
jgi:hypothetical protein